MQQRPRAKVAQMRDGKNGRFRNPGVEMAARLHDIAAGMAVGIGLLKGAADNSPAQDNNGLEILESVLAEVQQLYRARQGTYVSSSTVDVASGLREEAARLRIELELEVAGDADWLSVQERQLLQLAARESIRNVKRHSGSAKCRMTIDLSDCPFVLQAHDWGAGIDPTSRPGRGFERLRDLATGLGCELAVGSQPGLGTTLVLIGRRCPYRKKETTIGELDGVRLRSVVAEESLSSRGRVATRRPNHRPEQQIGEI